MLDPAVAPIVPIYAADQKMKCKGCVIATIGQPGTDMVDECAVPMYQRPAGIELPECNKHNLLRITQEFKTFFCTTPGLTNVTYHFISTTGNPSRFHPGVYRRIIKRK